MDTLYERTAKKIEELIEGGVYLPGERVPGVRKLSRQFGVSVSTIVEAERLLEDGGFLEARPRSGYYVRLKTNNQPDLPEISKPSSRPTLVTGQRLVLRMVQASLQPDIINLGTALPVASLLPEKQLQKAICAEARQSSEWIGRYALPPGRIELRRQIAKRMAENGCHATPDDIVITNGCQEAFTLALRAVAKAGDIIVIESPSYYGMLQVVESLGMKALEVPTDSKEGISIPALKLALEKWPVKACALVTNFSNPLGYCMPDKKKKALVNLLANYDVPLIEDDIYGDLGFGKERPHPAKSFDKAGIVLYCSSFSKTIAPSLRLGWIDPGRYREDVSYLKYIANQATPTLSQLAVARFLEGGGYDRYLRRTRDEYKRLVRHMIQSVSKYFPKGSKVTQPDGGFTIWIELPNEVDSLQMFEEALTQKICIAPGPLFSASQKYQHFIRLSCPYRWNERIELAMVALGKIAERLKAANK